MTSQFAIISSDHTLLRPGVASVFLDVYFNVSYKTFFKFRQSHVIQYASILFEKSNDI